MASESACPRMRQCPNQLVGEFIRGSVWGPSPGPEASHELKLEPLSHILWVSSPKTSPPPRRIPTAHLLLSHVVLPLVPAGFVWCHPAPVVKAVMARRVLSAPSLTLSPGDAHFAQVLLRQKLGQVLDPPCCLFRNLLSPLALDSTVEFGMDALPWVLGCPSCHNSLPCPSPLHLGRRPMNSWHCQTFSSTFPFQRKKKTPG